METGSMGDVTVKVRKPYTITKQRERWTEEEHNKFLEALKLYGRAWQRIEEHIGTKTAVQIRSHAQKFFSKLEKEALTKGIPLRLAHDIDVPPPRPKRKPRNPYPRKTVAGSLSICREGNQENPSKPVPSMSTNLQVLDTDSSAPGEEPALSENLPRKESSENHRCSGVLNLFQEAPSASVSSANKSSTNPYVCEVVPVVKEVGLALNKSFPIVEEDDHDMEFDGQKSSNVDKFDRFGKNPQLKLTREEKDIQKQPEEPGFSSKDDTQDSKNYSENVFVKFTDGISAKCMQTSNSEGQFPSSMTDHEGSHANANLFGNPPISAASEVYGNHAMSFNPLFAGQFPPFTHFQNNQDAYRSFVNFSPSFSGLIMSTLIHNPAVHAAACVAASLWPSQDADTSVDSASKTLEGGFPARHMNPSPSMAAIAAATVAAASAWWATHGLLPLFPPLHSVLSFTTTPAPTNPSVDVTPHLQADREVQADALHTATKDQHLVNPQNSDILETDPLKTLSPSLSSSSSSDLDVGQQSKREGCLELKSPSANKFDNSSSTRFDDSDNARSKKKLDRSSCGSNTPSSSDLETPTMLDKQDELKEEKETHFNSTLPGESSTRRSKISGNISESWKEVSEEGRLAFQALFMREILPQSFSSPHGKKKDATSLPVDLNWKACPVIDKNQVQGFTEERSRSNDNPGEGPLLCESGYGKLKTRRMGFKPYKRCSVEAKENRATGTGEEKGNKRIRVDGET